MFRIALMLRFVLITLCAIAALPAAQINVVPLDAVQWNNDSAVPTTSGIARRGQVYYLADFADEAGRKMYGGLRNSVRDKKLANKYDLIHILLAPGNTIEQRKEEDPIEYWCKGMPQNGGLVRAFVGDFVGALVIIDGSGRVTHISRLTNPQANEKQIKDAPKYAAPLVENSTLFPLSCAEQLEWLRLGDTNRALKEIRKAGQDAPTFVKLVIERINALIEMDTALITDMTKSPSERLIALNRLKGLVQENPSAPAAKEAIKSIKSTKDDKDLATEQAAFGVLLEYFNVMRKTSAKNTAMVQAQWLGGINHKFPGSYAAEIATMIKTASQLQDK